MKSKGLILVLVVGVFFIICVLPIVNSAEASMGTFKQGENVRVTQTCADATYVTISSISTPDSKAHAQGKSMISVGNGEFYYDFNSTSQIGRYDVRGVSDGCQESFVSYFEVTPSGFTGTLGFYLVLLVVCTLVVILGFSIKEAWFVVLGGLALIMLGVYSINYGVAGFRDMFMTWGVGLFEIAIGAMLSIGSAFQKLYYD